MPPEMVAKKQFSVGAAGVMIEKGGKPVDRPSYSACTIWAALLVQLACLVLGWGYMQRTFVQLELAAEEQQMEDAGATVPQGVSKTVMVTAHLGGQFEGIEGVFETNKLSFAKESNMSLFAVETMQQDPRFLPALDVPVLKSSRFKYVAIQQLFEHFPHIEWALWVDGDTWLSTAQPLKMEKLLGEHPGDFVVGMEHADPPHGCLRFNAGVFAVRNTKWSRQFIKSILAAPTGPEAYADVASDFSPEDMPQGFDDQCAIAMLVDQLPDDEQDKVTAVPATETAERLQCRTTYKCSRYFPHLCCTHDSWCLHVANSDWKDLVGVAVEMEASALVGTVEEAGDAAVSRVESVLTILETEMCAGVSAALGSVPDLCEHVCAVHGCGDAAAKTVVAVDPETGSVLQTEDGAAVGTAREHQIVAETSRASEAILSSRQARRKAGLETSQLALSDEERGHAEAATADCVHSRDWLKLLGVLGSTVLLGVVVHWCCTLDPSPAGSGLPDRVRSLDGLRGLMALGVLLFHACDAGQCSAAVPAGVQRVLSRGFPVMSLFFVLSGAVTFNSLEETSKGYIWRRFVGLAPAYWAMLLVSALSYRDGIGDGTFWYSWASSMGAAQAWLPTSACGHSLLWIHDGPAWFVSALVPCMLAAPWLSRPMRSWSVLACAACVVVCCLLRSIPAMLMLHGAWYDNDAAASASAQDARSWYVFPPLRLLEFVVGMCAARFAALAKRDDQQGTWRVVSDAAFALFIATLAMNAPHPKVPFARVGLLDGGAVLVSGFLIASLLRVHAGEKQDDAKPSVRPTGLVHQFLGASVFSVHLAKCSYAMFLFQVPVLSAWRHASRHLGMANVATLQAEMARLLVIVAVVTGAAMLWHSTVDRRLHKHLGDGSLTARVGA